MSHPIKPYNLYKNYYNYVNENKSTIQRRHKVQENRRQVWVPVQKSKKVNNNLNGYLEELIPFVTDYVKMNWLKIMRLLVATSIIFYCCYHALTITMMYLDYKTKVTVSVSEPEIVHMPGITICTNTRLDQNQSIFCITVIFIFLTVLLRPIN
jgi:hypothetical protein